MLSGLSQEPSHERTTNTCLQGEYSSSTVISLVAESLGLTKQKQNLARPQTVDSPVNPEPHLVLLTG